MHRGKILKTLNWRETEHVANSISFIAPDRKAFSVWCKIRITVPRLSEGIPLLNVPVKNLIEDLRGLSCASKLCNTSRKDPKLIFQDWNPISIISLNTPHICLSTGQWSRAALSGLGGITCHFFPPLQCKNFSSLAVFFLYLVLCQKVIHQCVWDVVATMCFYAVTLLYKMCLKAQTVLMFKVLNPAGDIPFSVSTYLTLKRRIKDIHSELL